MIVAIWIDGGILACQETASGLKAINPVICDECGRDGWLDEIELVRDGWIYTCPKCRAEKGVGTMYGVKKYYKWFEMEHGWKHCLSVNCDDPNLAFPPHSTHHIFSRGRYPRHPELHNHLNLIMLCNKCHTEFEEFKRQEEYEQLVEERGLDILFNN